MIRSTYPRVRRKHGFCYYAGTAVFYFLAYITAVIWAPFYFVYRCLAKSNTEDKEKWKP